MGKILVIEPQRVLQQAIAMALHSDNDVELTDAIPESLNVKEFDAVIVDAASLRERSGLGAQAVRTIEAWQLPTIWIDDDGSEQAPNRDKFVILKQPVSREALLASLGKCLKPLEAKTAAAERETDSTKSATSNEPEKFIDLVDVVEEEPANQKPNSGQEE
jgi:DNA-binding NtrC family response regulator